MIAFMDSGFKNARLSIIDWLFNWVYPQKNQVLMIERKTTLIQKEPSIKKN